MKARPYNLSHRPIFRMAEWRGTSYPYQGFIYNDLGKKQAAIEDCNIAIKLNPMLSDAYTNRGMALRNLGKCEEAFRDYAKAVEIDPGNPHPYNARA